MLRLFSLLLLCSCSCATVSPDYYRLSAQVAERGLSACLRDGRASVQTCIAQAESSCAAAGQELDCGAYTLCGVPDSLPSRVNLPGTGEVDHEEVRAAVVAVPRE